MSMSLDRRRKVAEILLRVKAIQLRPEDPFTWASGRKSPIYCDNRKTLSHPNVRTYLRQALAELVGEAHGRPDAIAGVATGGIAIGALVAQELGLPFIYVRSEAKSHGMGNQIEGDLSVLSNVVVIEDLVSTGKSSLLAVKALEAAGIDVKGLIAIFTYGFDEAYAAFEQAGCKWEALTDYPTLLEQATAEGYIADAQREALSAWSADAKGWSEAHLAKSASA